MKHITLVLMVCLLSGCSEEDLGSLSGETSLTSQSYCGSVKAMASEWVGMNYATNSQGFDLKNWDYTSTFPVTLYESDGTQRDTNMYVLSGDECQGRVTITGGTPGSFNGTWRYFRRIDGHMMMCLDNATSPCHEFIE